MWLNDEESKKMAEIEQYVQENLEQLEKEALSFEQIAILNNTKRTFYKVNNMKETGQVYA